MKDNETTCPCCQQVFNLCECDFEAHLKYLRDEDAKDYHEEVNRSASDKAASTVNLNTNLNHNRFRNVR